MGIDETKTGRQNMTIQEWQGLAAGWDDSPYGSGPVPHSRYVMIGSGEFSFDPSLTNSGGSTIKPVAGSTVHDDDSVGNSKVVDGENYCLDVALGGNLEVWTAPLIEGRVAVGLFNRSPAAAVITATWTDLGLSANAEYDAVDVWGGKSAGKRLQGSISSHTEHHSLTLLILSPSSP